MSAKRFVFACSLVSLALVACADKPRQILVDEVETRPVETLYNEAMADALRGDYEAAAPKFDEVERQHPYSVWATQAQLMAAYAHYQRNKYDEAVAALDRFIKLNPGNPNAAYALYLKGLCYYEQITDVGRDQTVTHQAMATFESLIARYPENPYTRDARLKIDLTRNHLAGKEMAIGRFYADREQYLAAINRFRQVVVTYDTTDQVPEALHRLTEIYLTLGLDTEARKTAAVLGHNYPGSPWYADSYRLLTGKDAGEGESSADGESGLVRRLWSGFKGLF